MDVDTQTAHADFSCSTPELVPEALDVQPSSTIGNDKSIFAQCTCNSREVRCSCRLLSAL